MEPYNPNLPFIRFANDGKTVLDRMVEAGIPLTRALQYFRDNPEGNALEFFKLIGEDVIPFYGNYRNGGDVSDYAKEAVLLAMPVPNKRGRYTADPVRTKEFNANLKEIAKKQRREEGYSPYDELALKQPISLEKYNWIRNNREYYKELEPVWDDVIVEGGRGTPYYTSENPPQTYTYNTKAQWRQNLFGGDEVPPSPHMANSEFMAQRYNPEYINSRLEEVNSGYNFRAGDLDALLKSKRSPMTLYKQDFYEPYRDVPGSYLKEELHGIEGEARSTLIELGQRYESILLDKTIPVEVKASKLDAIKRQIEDLEAIERLK